MRRENGFALFASLAVLGFLCLLSSCLGYLAPERSSVSRTRAVMRRIGLDLDERFERTGAYPPFSADPNENLFGPVVERNPDLEATVSQLSTIRSDEAMLPESEESIVHIPEQLIAWGIDGTFTKEVRPICYIAFPDIDPYKGPAWVLWGAGPDHDYDLTAANLTQAVTDGSTEGTHWDAYWSLVQSRTYDPTNGLESTGDVWRVAVPKYNPPVGDDP